MSIRPAKRRSTASTAIIWWRRCARAATAQVDSAATAREQLAGIVKGLAKPGDYVVCLGAGNITQWAYALAEAS